MISWLTERHRLVLAVTIGHSLLGTIRYFRFVDISFGLPIFVFITFATILIYLFCYSWPFIGAAIIEANKNFIGASWLKPESLAKFLLWLALLSLLLATVGMVVGDAESALSASGSCGLLAGTCCYLRGNKSESEQAAVGNGDQRD